MYNFLLVDASQSCACNKERLPRLFFLAFPGYLVWQRPFRAYLRVKKELVERISVDLALRVRGCTMGVQRSIEK